MNKIKDFLVHYPLYKECKICDDDFCEIDRMLSGLESYIIETYCMECNEKRPFIICERNHYECSMDGSRIVFNGNRLSLKKALEYSKYFESSILYNCTANKEHKIRIYIYLTNILLKKSAKLHLFLTSMLQL